MNGCQASFAVVGCASSDVFTSQRAFAGLESTLARVGWLEYAQDFVAPMLSRWQPLGVVWDMPGGKELDERGLIRFPLARFGALEKANARLSFDEFCAAIRFLQLNCDVKQQVVYLGGLRGDLGRVLRAMEEAFGERMAAEMLECFVHRLTDAGATAVVFDSTAEAEVQEVGSMAIMMCEHTCKPAVMCVEGPPARSQETWMRAYKFGAWQTTEAYRNQRWELDQSKVIADTTLAELALGGWWRGRRRRLAMMGYNGVCPLGHLDRQAAMAGWLAEWIGQCVRSGIVPCWSFLGNEELCEVAEKARIDAGGGGGGGA